MNQKKQNVSMSVIRRLPRYYRFLSELGKNGATRISSKELSEKMGFTASQIRQDFNCFGGFGQQGYGYNVSQLCGEIEKILGIQKRHPCILVGAGNLPSFAVIAALLRIVSRFSVFNFCSARRTIPVADAYCSKPVSYTHLDVYKRQPLTISVFFTGSIASSNAFCTSS